MEIQVFDSGQELAEATAKHLASRLSSGGRRSLGLAGGSTPRATYEALAGLDLSWDDVDLWLGDERWVPLDSPDSNARMATERLLDGVDARLHVIEYGDGSDPEAAAAVYETELEEVFADTGGNADTVLLGLGDDGHTASLFPGSDVLDEQARRYVAAFVPHLDMWRLTATIPLLARAEEIVFLVSGENKADPVRWLVDPGPEDPLVPARMVITQASAISLFLDKGAASKIA